MLCAIHCLAMPFVVIVFSWAGLTLLENPLIELLTIAFIVLFGGISIFDGYKKTKDARALIIFFLGCLVLAAQFISHLHILIAVGTSIVAISQIVNWRVQKSCACSLGIGNQ